MLTWYRWVDARATLLKSRPAARDNAVVMVGYLMYRYCWVGRIILVRMHIGLASLKPHLA